jgi:hypothetical protein
MVYMNKSLFFALFSFLFAADVAASAPPELAWSVWERGVSVALSNDGHVYILDYEYNPAEDIYLKKYTVDGDSVWTVKYDQTDPTKWEQAQWVETDGQNNILVSGTLKSGYSNPVNAASILMKFSPDGQLLWRKVYESDFDGSYTRRCLIDREDNIYVLGLGAGPTGLVTKVKKFKPNGETAWIFYDTLGIGAPQIFKFSQDSAIVIAGRGIVGSVNGFAKINLEGQLLWAKAPVFSLTVGDIAGDADGNAYIINDNYETSEGSILTKLSPTGEVLWVADAPFSGFRVEVGTDQQPVISGFPGSGQPGVSMMKWNVDGSEAWKNLDADGPLNLLLHARMQLDAENNAYLAAGTLFDNAVCKVNADGTSGWTFTNPGSSGAQSFVIAKNNSLYVTGIKTFRINQNLSTGIQQQVSYKTLEHLSAARKRSDQR